jgi:isoquinoline 1-oxidoreductase beta subunit
MLIDRINETVRARAGGLSRRAFIKVGAAAGGGLLLSVGLPVFRGDGEAATDVFAPDAFIRIDTSGQVTMVMPQVEMGQGTYTSIPMLIAEELEVELATVQLEHAPPNDKLYANPLIGFQATGGSTSVRGFWEPLRRAGATARTMLISAATAQWGVAAGDCRAEKGVVIHAASGRKLAMASWRQAAGLPVPEKVALKDPKDFKLIGTPAKRLDTPAKVNGTAVFGIDTKLPGMKIATVAISPVFGGKLAKVDDSKALAVKGVRQVVKLDDAVAVVADHMGAAKKGMEALEITWDEGANAKLSTGDILQQLESAAAKPGVVGTQEGDVEKAHGGCCQEGRGELSHALPRPCRHGADELHGACDQGFLRGLGGHPGRARAQATAADVTGLPLEKVQVHNHLLGGGFGRRLDIDGVTLAVRIAKQVEGPVKVVWTREEDIQHDIYRPFYYGRLTAGLDATGAPVAWHHRVVGSSILARWYPAAFKDGLDSDAVEGAAGPTAFPMSW